MIETIIISGISGMDGTCLAHYLLSKGHKVIGIVRRNSTSNEQRIQFLKDRPNFHLMYADITDAGSIDRVVECYKPDKFFHLAANSFVHTSWASPNHYVETNTIGTINVLESLRKYAKGCKFYFAASSEQYGKYIKCANGAALLNENSPMNSASPYGVSKVAGYQMTRVFRESYNMFASCGILFNHCHELRGEEFFTRKVTSQLAKVKWGVQDYIELGNLTPQRDEGYSGDYVVAMDMMLNYDKPDDFVIATGKTHSCQKWAELTCAHFDLDFNKVVKVDTDLFRPNEVNVLIGDASKAKRVLGWEPKVSFEDLNYRMCEYDYYAQSPNSADVKKSRELLWK